jgi:hypothetical protein
MPAFDRCVDKSTHRSIGYAYATFRQRARWRRATTAVAGIDVRIDPEGVGYP